MTPFVRTLATRLSSLAVLVRAEDAELEDIEAAAQAFIDQVNQSTGSTLELPDGQPATVREALAIINLATADLGKGELVDAGRHLCSMFDTPHPAPDAADEGTAASDEGEAAPSDDGWTLATLQAMTVAQLNELAGDLDLVTGGKKAEKVAAIAAALGLE